MIKKVMSLSMSINIQKMLNKISKNIIKRLSKNENDKNKKNHMNNTNIRTNYSFTCK